MPGTIATTLLTGLEEWLQNAESTDARKLSDTAQNAMHNIAVNSLFNQIALIIQVLGTDAEGWKDIANFIQQQRSRYKSDAVRGCLNVLNKIAGLIIPKE